MLIWLYLSWLILLVGSQIAYFVQNPKFMTLHRVRFVLSNRLREQLALQIMYLVGYHHFHDRPPWSLEQLIEYLDLPDEPVSRMLQVLVDTGYLAELHEEDATRYLPQHAIETTRLADLVAAVRNAGESRFLSIDQLTTSDPVAGLTGRIGRAIGSEVGDLTLGSLVEQTDPRLETAGAVQD